MKVAGPARAKRWLRLAGGCAVSALALWFTLRNVHFSRLRPDMARASVALLVLALVPKAIGFGFVTLRSQLVLRPLRRVSTGPVLRSHVLAFVGNNILPLRMGELLRVDYLARVFGLHRASTLAVVGLERLLDMLALSVLALGVAARVAPVGALRTRLFLLAVIVALAIVLLYSSRRWLARETSRKPAFALPRIRALLERFFTGLAAVGSPARMGGAAAATVGFWAMSVLSTRLWIAAFHLDLPWYAALVVLALAAFATALPSSPAFVGTYHLGVAIALSLLGVEPTLCVSFALVCHLMATVPFTMLGLLVLRKELTGSVKAFGRDHPSSASLSHAALPYGGSKR